MFFHARHLLMYDFCCGHFSIRDTTFTSLDKTDVSPQAKRAKPTYLAVDKENQIIGYVVPIFRGRYEPGLMHSRNDGEHKLGFRTQGYLLILVFQ